MSWPRVLIAYLGSTPTGRIPRSRRGQDLLPVTFLPSSHSSPLAPSVPSWACCSLASLAWQLDRSITTSTCSRSGIGGMPSCDGFVPDVLKGGAGTGTGTSNGSSGGTGGTADGLDCASLLAEHPECQTCVYKCGSEPSKCAGGLTGMCSPVCFSGKLTTCQVGGGDVNNEMVETDATSDGDTLKMNVMLKGIMMMAAAGMLYFSF